MLIPAPGDSIVIMSLVNVWTHCYRHCGTSVIPYNKSQSKTRTCALDVKVESATGLVDRVDNADLFLI